MFWGSTFTSSVPGVGAGRGAYGYYEVHDFGTFGVAEANIAHIYAQDQWSIGNLTLNLGVRFENEVIPSFRTDLAENAVDFGFGEKIAPRIGAAYDVVGNGRMKIFGAYGRYYDWTKYELSRGAFGGDIWTGVLPFARRSERRFPRSAWPTCLAGICGAARRASAIAASRTSRRSIRTSSR